MGWIGFWSKQKLIDIIQRELYSKSNLEKMVIEIEREIYIPPVVSQDEIRKLVEKMLTEHHSMAGREKNFTLNKTDLQKISQEVILSLKQEIYEELSRAQVDLGKKFERRIQNLEDKVTNLPKYTPVAPSPVDFTPFQNAITQIQAEQKLLGLRLTKIEAKINAPQPTAVPVGVRNTLQEQRLFELEKQNASQVRELAALKRQLESLQKQIEKLINSGVVTSPTQPVVPFAPVQPVKPKIKPWIKFFSLPKPTKLMAFFHGDGLAVKTKLGQSIQEMDGLIIYLTQSKIVEPARTSFMKNLNWCMEALEKLYKKFDFDSCEAEELSEKITDKFFKIITDNLLDNVMVAIYRGGKNAVGYQDFLQNVNRYLSKHGIYTENIEPGIVINRDMVSNIEPPITKYTSVATDDGKVDEVELLPYFMSYEDDDGKLDTVRKRGRIVLLKYGA